MLELTHRAMACDFVVLVRDENQRIGHRAVADVVLDCLEEIDDLESRWTVHRASSEISKVNQAAGGDPVRVSAATWDLLVEADRLCRETDGAFDISAGPLIEAWGFTERQGRKPTGDEIAESLSLVGPDALRLDHVKRTASLTQPGMRINLGAIGKGAAIDRIAGQLESAGVENFLIHAGMSSVIARGDQFAEPLTTLESAPDADTKKVPPEGDRSTLHQAPSGWMIGIAHPTKPHIRLAGVWLHNAALSTSGSGKQFFHHRGQRYGHVIDPRTGYPAGDLLSISVKTVRAIDADALATALFVMGRNEIDAWMSRSARENPTDLFLVGATERQDAVRIETRGTWAWAEEPVLSL